MICAVLAENEKEEINYHISSNDGASSSIFNFAEHARMWPEVTMTKILNLTSRRFDCLVEEEKIDLSRFDTLILDVQGAELAVLRGMGETLKNFVRLETEAADFDAYEGGTTADEIIKFCTQAGFVEIERLIIKETEGIGKYFDVRFTKQS